MKLYVIFRDNNDGAVKLQEVTITKETEKQYLINCPGVNRQVVLKSQLEIFLDGCFFGYDKGVLVSKWNAHQEANLGYLKRQLQEVKAQIVSDDMKLKLVS